MKNSKLTQILKIEAFPFDLALKLRGIAKQRSTEDKKITIREVVVVALEEYAKNHYKANGQR